MQPPLRPGDLPGRPTQVDVARRAGVSRALVSLVMRGASNVSPERRDQVLRAAQELGYRPNASARSLASKDNRTLGVLINDVTNPYFGAVYASLAVAAEQAGYDLLVAPGLRSAEREGSLVGTLLEHRVAGLVLLSPIMTRSALAALCAAWPTVVVGREDGLPRVDVVTTDEEQAAESAIAHLTALGHTRIAHISGGSNKPARARSSAFEAAVTGRGLEPVVVNGSFTPEGGRHGAGALFGDGPAPTALVAANDLIAVGAMGHLRATGRQVPADVSVVGYDDSEVARLDLVRLTSIRQPTDRFGEAAVAMMEDRLRTPDRPARVQRLATELVVRSTTSAAETTR